MQAVSPRLGRDAMSTIVKRATEAWRSMNNTPPDRSGAADDPWQARYLQGYLLLRIFIGVVALAMPVVLYLGSALLPGGSWSLRGALSDYYYSAMRDDFTCSLWVIGFFLFTYKAFERTLENLLTGVAGAMAILFAFFPTTPSSTTTPLTPLQQGLGEHAVDAVHFVSASTFGVLMAAICYAFGSREALRPPAPGRHSPEFWRRFHHVCAYVILGVAVLYGGFKIALHYGASFGGAIDDHALWFIEVVSFTTFAISWLCKGSELKTHPIVSGQ
jgi:hypothetical protein